MEFKDTRVQFLILILLTLIAFFDIISINYGTDVFLGELNLFFLFSMLLFYLPIILLILGIVLFVYFGKKKGMGVRNLIWISVLIFLYGIKITANLLTLVNFKLGF